VTGSLIILGYGLVEFQSNSGFGNWT
jgi:hypothetical protein